ncbi:hypothetical protein R3P38DRAFT_3167468 [Favolaschia claudopus]|uniref:Uncharacterized protein n=1 Tax=Favolaschia claudopus TaxID=2862362 RepID=A0AAW0EBM3_9AGAR
MTRCVYTARQSSIAHAEASGGHQLAVKKSSRPLNAVDITTRESPSQAAFPQDALNAQLQLSQPAGLNIEFNIEDSEQAFNLCDTLGTLIEESNRWSRFTLSWVGCLDILSLLSKIEGRLGQLEYLKLDPLQTDGDYWSSQFTNIFSLAPRLRELNVNTFHLDDYRFCANSLIDAVLRLDKSDEASPGATMELLYLKRLSLTNDWDCECLDVPDLTHLTLSGHIGNILSILNHSQCQLQTLELDDCHIHPDALHSVLPISFTDLNYLRVGFGFWFRLRRPRGPGESHSPGVDVIG